MGFSDMIVVFEMEHFTLPTRMSRLISKCRLLLKWSWRYFWMKWLKQDTEIIIAVKTSTNISFLSNCHFFFVISSIENDFKYSRYYYIFFKLNKDAIFNSLNYFKCLSFLLWSIRELKRTPLKMIDSQI